MRGIHNIEAEYLTFFSDLKGKKLMYINTVYFETCLSQQFFSRHASFNESGTLDQNRTTE